jgi:hypothetical protein
MTLGAVAGTMSGGTIRTLSLPFGDAPDLAAVRAVVLSWCEANGLPPGRMRERDYIEIHPDDLGQADLGRHVIMWREFIPPPAGATGSQREGSTKLRKTPLLVEPAGLLTEDESTCGHVRIERSPVLGAPALLFVCDQGVDPATGRHPAQHTGDYAGEHRPPGGEPPRRPETQGYRMSWDNEHPGDQAFRDGVPYLGGMAPHLAHALILARLKAIADRRPPVNRRNVLVSLHAHVLGLREIALRHEPRDTRDAGTVCDHDFVSATGLTPWPCAEVRDALAGIVAFPPAATR